MPIEYGLIKKGINTDKSLSFTEKRNNCKKYALEQIEIQKKQFSRLGLLSDMSEIYTTLDTTFEVAQLNIFLNIVKKKLLYRSLKPIY
jgi:isoleucyl-tRNA synthetase